ncbi:glutathione S-transferase family protein [Sneathiella sp. CAU 1612]|uniref:Glutathione S-transferase family protein n=1 Tax=Sneathiella sedimenti TaxID=2816034 RepID=A0ABS3F6C8_9PROT|nr:glutathione S-transferase family protein [Sneathiella sedimenti]MBO0334079.1 glutathione S-transferase family protein [Sneathiella sedimenti]
MKLYDCPGPPSPRRVRIFMAEKGIDLEKVIVNMRDGEQLSEEFKKINPHCTVPVLELDDGSRISSIDAINRYLEEKFPEPPLFGKSPEERARINDCNHYVNVNGFMAVAEALRNSAPRLAHRAITGPRNVEQIAELAERGRQRVVYFFEDMNKQLEGQEFVAGDNYSVADIGAMVVVDFATGMAKIEMPDGLNNLKRWHDAVSARPSASA